MFKDKTYLRLWKLMLSREPYCSEYKVSFGVCSFLRLCEFCYLTHTPQINLLNVLFAQNILHLVHIMLVLPVSAGVCERGFSAQKRIKSDKSIPSFRDSGWPDKNQCGGAKTGRFDARECGKLVHPRWKIKKAKLQQLAIWGACDYIRRQSIRYQVVRILKCSVWNLWHFKGLLI